MSMERGGLEVHGEGGDRPQFDQSPPQIAVAMLLNRELTPDEAEEVSVAVDEGLTDLFDIASRIEPGRVFYPWEKIVLGAMFNPVLAHTGSSSEGT